jgi:hypothetical protein
MGFRPFMENSNKPTDEILNDVLGNAYSYYRDLLDLLKVYSQEWIYAKSSGWMLKIFDPHSSFLHIIPLREEFVVNLAIRENEKENILNNIYLEELHNQLKASQKHSEGYGLKFEVASVKEYRQVKLLVDQLIILRK